VILRGSFQIDFQAEFPLQKMYVVEVISPPQQNHSFSVEIGVTLSEHALWRRVGVVDNKKQFQSVSEQEIFFPEILLL
jgi:hypothetical protein